MASLPADGGELRETDQFSCHEHNPLGIGSCSFAVISGLKPFRDSLTCCLASPPFVPTHIKHRVATMPARLNTRPVASDYHAGIRTPLELRDIA
jgi:hypothetical protein